MRINEKSWMIHAACVVVFVVAYLSPMLMELARRHHASTVAFDATIPAISDEEIRVQLDHFTQLAANPGPLAEYRPRVLQGISDLYTRCGKTARIGGMNTTVGLCVDRSMPGVSTLQGELEHGYRYKYGEKAMGDALWSYGQKYGHNSLWPASPSPPTGDLWLGLYLHMLPFAVVMLLVRLKEEQLSILRELVGRPFRFILASITAPASFWLYPKTDAVQQRLESLRFAAITLGTFMCGGAAAKAQTASGTSKNDNGKKYAFVLGASASYNTAYMGGLSAQPFAGSVLQQSITLSHRGFYLGTWNSLDPAHPNTNYGTEVDWYLGKSFSVGPLGIDTNLTYVDLWHVGKSRDNVYDASITLAIPKNKLKPYVRVDDILSPHLQVIGQGVAWRGGIAPSQGPLSVDLSASGNDGALGFRPQRVGSLRIVTTLSRKVRRGMVSLYGAYQHGLDTGRPGAISPHHTLWGGLRWSHSLQF